MPSEQPDDLVKHLDRKVKKAKAALRRILKITNDPGLTNKEKVEQIRAISHREIIGKQEF